MEIQGSTLNHQPAVIGEGVQPLCEQAQTIAEQSPDRRWRNQSPAGFLNHKNAKLMHPCNRIAQPIADVVPLAGIAIKMGGHKTTQGIDQNSLLS